MNGRRSLLTSALVLPALAVAACTTASGNATVSAVLNDIQFLLPLVDTLALGIAIAVPAAAPIVAVVSPYLTAAAPIFQTLSATMTTVQALPIVGQIEGYLKGAVDAVQTAVNGAPAGSSLARFSTQVQQASAALALVTAFVNGVQALPSAASVPLPLLHR